MQSANVVTLQYKKRTRHPNTSRRHPDSGKYGNKSNDYFATNSSSNKIHLAKFSNPYKGPATEKQLAQCERFATKQAACTAWLNTNRPSEKNGLKGTADYQHLQKLKRTFAFSNINQVIYKYMDDEGNIKLPQAHPQRLNWVVM